MSALPANGANGLEAGDQYRANAALQYRLATPTLKNTLAHYKIWLFTGSGVMMAASGWSLFRPNRTLPGRPGKGQGLRPGASLEHQYFQRFGRYLADRFTAAYLSLPLLTIYDRLVG